MTVHGPRVAETFDTKLASFLGDGRTITGTADVQEAFTNWIEIEIVEVEEAVRQEALDRLHFVTSNGARMLGSHYTVAGERFHAERIRQKLGRSTARRTAPPEGDTASSDVPRGGDPSVARQPEEVPPAQVDAATDTQTDSASEKSDG